MTNPALDGSNGVERRQEDMDGEFHALKNLIKELKAENKESVTREIFGAEESDRQLTKTQMKKLFRLLRKIERQCTELERPPIPRELEAFIKKRDSSEWLPWELEAVEKLEVWRKELRDRKETARDMFNCTLAKVRKGEALP
jgi:hypothetical protein